MRDESQLAFFLDRKYVDYLAAFPEFYPQLIQQRDIVFQTSGEISPSLDLGNMTIYRWK
jgi:hypothetical protein